ncbi:MAG: hypothetical protein NT150_10310 [Bacteroidetes bacterium]|nr:hypothetical protein [Bacteroidota bacterium]
MKKKIFTIVFFLLTGYFSVLAQHNLSMDFGSLRNRYLYPITNLKYTSPIIKSINTKVSLRLRSYGTLYVFSLSAYDITPHLEYVIPRKFKSLQFSAGFGLDARIRLVNDQRSTAVSSAEPFLSLGVHCSHKKLFFAVPCWTRFYSNGISHTILPELSFRFHEKVAAFIRCEVSYLSLYNDSSQEWRNDSFIGVNYCF